MTAAAIDAGDDLPDVKTRRNAWFMALAAMLGTMCCSTSVILVNVGVFMSPLEKTFSWNRGDIALSLSIAAISMAAANPIVGKLIDRVGVRPVLISSLIGYGAIVAVTPWMIESASINGLYLAYAAIAGIGAGSNIIAYVRLLSGWFSGPMTKHRGLALGMSSAGMPLGHTVSGPLAIILIDQLGWQGGYWGLALLPLLIGLPIALFFIRPAPNERAMLARAKADRTSLPGMTVAEAMRTRAFWLLLAIALLMSSCLQGIGIHVAPLLSDFNMPAGTLALALAINGALGIPARIGAGFLFDRFFAPYVSLGVFLIAAISAFCFVGFPGLWVAIITTLVIKLGEGAESDFLGYVIGRYFGLRNYGQIFGFVYALFMIGIALGPYLFGRAYDAWGDYKISFLIAGIGLCLVCVLLLMMPRFRDKPEHEPT